MTERPILFSDAMVRAILAGTKTQTRRVVTPQPVARWGSHLVPCPYGAPGDRLWVRECFALHHAWDEHAPTRGGAASKRVWFRAHHDSGIIDGIGRWRPSIHMPRWASRLTLEVTSVRVERVQSITESDARAEGVATFAGIGADQTLPGTSITQGTHPHVVAFASLWDSINGARPGCSWSANPWCWVLGFRRLP